MPVRLAIRAEFDYLKSKNHFVKGYVIMPNHLPVLIEFSNSTKSINTIVSNGKRFIAYEIVKRLQEQDQHEIYLHTVSCCSTRLGVETRLGRGLTKFESKKFIPVSENKFSFTHKFFGTSSSAALAVIVK